MIDDEIRRCAKLLESLVRMGGMSARQLEERLGYGAGTVHRLFNGRIELKLRHILLILEVVGVPASQFFREVFPDDERPRSEPETAARLLDLLEKYVPKRDRPPEPPRPKLSQDEIDDRIIAVLTRYGILDRESEEPEPAPPPPPPGRRPRRKG